ncbi:MAG: methyltransferase domain-containing protein [Gammaproteobacteria bacterium]|nr:methyltransferase domain-containing protein [Gammaproteobacteria bacterium]
MKNALYEKLESLLELDLNRKYKVLDIGCGHGELLGHLSDAMNSESVLVGIDEIENSVEGAKENYPHLDFLREKFTDSFSFEDDCFDIVVSVDALECIPNKSALLDEVHRVLKPGGKVVFAHWDWDTQVYNSENKSSIRKFTAAFSDWQQDWMETSDGQMGRRLWGLFEGSGKFKGKIACFTLLETEYREGKYGFDRLRDLSGLVEAGNIESAEYKMTCDEMQSLSDTNKYFYSVNSYIYVGEPA